MGRNTEEYKEFDDMDLSALREIGNIIAGFVIAKWFESTQVINGVEVLVKDWAGIWMVFAVYSLVVAVLFAVFFKYKHDPKAVENFKH